MVLSVFDFSITQFRSTLSGIQIILKKAEAHVLASHQSPDSLLHARLQADMLPLAFQLDQAANASAGALRRIRGETVETARVFDDFAAASACIDEAAAYCQAIDLRDLEGRENTDVIWTAPKIELRYSATDYLISHALPNFYFHSVMAYAILRNLGIPIGKLNFLGRNHATRQEPRGTALAAIEAMTRQRGPR
ncbi:DUF1993 family protein [Rhizorhapis sp. SPR117]|uniref:DUF1993 family protein n=1 Tax=Rhizorhapis sp. SPR117 TaxID=2912611 RepID=UPI001F1B1F87|nr:DUF1993 domain-containing protein [Rhizorhapis sp. SPR117]